MRIYQIAFLLLLIGSLLTGCNNKNTREQMNPDNTDNLTEHSTDSLNNGISQDKKENSMEYNKETEDSQSEQIPYTLFAKPPKGWVGDIMPMTDKDGIQLYYLQDWRDNAEGFHPIHKFSTNNLINYSYDGEMVPLGGSSDPDLAIGTGSILVVDGVYHCFYTGHNYKFPEQGKNKECVMHAVSTDNINWTKIPEDTFLAPAGYEIHDFRDPFVFYNEEEERYWLLIAARKNDLGGVVAKFTSKDLKTWEVQEPLYAPESYFMLECPDLFKLGDYWYLVFSEFSHEKRTHYVMSKSINGPFMAPVEDAFDGNAFYAAKTTEYQGKRYIAGWIPTKPEEKDSNKYEWAGNMSVMELVQNADGTLSVKMVDQLNDYFAAPDTLTVKESIGDASFNDSKATLSTEENADASGINFGRIPQTMLVTGKVTFEEDGRGAGFAFGIEDDFTKGLGIHLDSQNDLIRYDASMIQRMRYANPNSKVNFNFETGVTYTFKLVVEKDLAVVYLNDDIALSTRIYRMQNNDWGLFCIGGKVVFDDLKIMTSKEIK
ncbi:MAG: glycoside hydrolase family protein [Lachnospiraceae bacterium]|jgi:beta-fructofuranosidase|nr:glycoside hydrolase family protein [Lachnospiraceae bacterium]